MHNFILKSIKSLGVVTVLAAFSGCTPSQIHQSINIAQQLPDMNTERAVRLVASQDPSLKRYLDAEAVLKKDLKKFLDLISDKWEADPKIASKKKYVKYSQNYISRAEVDFENHLIYVETLDRKNPKASLKKAITSTLLTPYDPENVDLHSDKEVKLGGEPFLYEQVVDHENKALRWEWRTGRYADYLLENSYRSKKIKTKKGQQKVYYVTIPMRKNVGSLQAQKLRPYVLEYAKRYDLNPALVYAVIETESSFNPYATSHIPAYGLMQIVPKSAGRDAWKFLNNRDGIPSKSYLYSEKNNIEMGSAYLHIVNTKYLKNIRNPRSREYCTIAAYNTGSGNVFKTFHRSDRAKAAQIINGLSPDEVYARLRSSLPYDETRRYVKKVTDAKKKYLNI